MKKALYIGLFGMFALSVASCSMMKKKDKDEKKPSKNKRRYHSELMVK